MRSRSVASALAVLVGAAATADAAAPGRDVVSPFVAEVVTRDDNVFRLADDVDPSTEIGTPSRADVYQTTSAGLAFDVVTGAQRFRGELALNRTRFTRFDNLDFDGSVVRAGWEWRAGERFFGDVGHESNETLASLANVQSGSRSTSPNVIQTRRSYVTATYEPSVHWQFRAGLRASLQHNRAVEYKPNDLDGRTTELAVAYVTEGMTRIGLSFLGMDGRLPNPQLVGGLAIDNSYRQRNLAVFLEWQPSSHSRIDARTGPSRRDYVQVPQRDFDGSVYVTTLEWRPTDDIAVTALLQRNVSADEEINVGLVLKEGVGLRASWNPRDKVALSMELERADRTYLGDAASALAGTTGLYSERVRGAAVRLSLHPGKRLTVDLGWRHERRWSLTGLGSYGAGIGSVGFRFTF